MKMTVSMVTLPYEKSGNRVHPIAALIYLPFLGAGAFAMASLRKFSVSAASAFCALDVFGFAKSLAAWVTSFFDGPATSDHFLSCESSMYGL